MDYRFPQAISRKVTRLCIADGSSREMRPLPNPVVGPAVTASSGSIVVCGGMEKNSPASTCQILSLHNNRLACHITNLCYPLKDADL